MKPLVDGDIIRYEIGFAAEASIRATTEDPEALPSWDYVQECLHRRLEEIETEVGATEDSVIYITEGPTFRDQIATKKPYKGTRIVNKPWHYNNLTSYMKHVLNCEVVELIEADDAMAIEHTKDPENTIICSRDKDLRQVPGWFYSWELGLQPSYGPIYISKEGHLELSEKNKLSGSGLAFFYAQCLMGDSVDNIPGLPKCGPVGAYDILKDLVEPSLLSDAVCEAYEHYYDDNWKEEFLEQGRLLWMTRRLDSEGKPVLWELGMTE